MVLANAGSLAGFALLAWILGADHALQPGTWRESDAFAIGVILATIVASAGAGAACSMIARRRGVAIVAGVMLAAWWGTEGAVKLEAQSGSGCPPRGAEASFVDGARHDLLVEPTWLVIASPIVVAGAVMLGAGVARGAVDGSDRAAS